MTIEEKARAYDEAIGKAQDVFHTSEFIKITDLFPDLAESEDERMLREIKRYLKEQGDKPTGLPNGTVAVSDMIAWLEKQKDASKAIEVVDRIDKYIDENVANAHDMKDSNPDKQYYRGWNEALGEMARILQDVYSGEKYKESLGDFIDNFPYSDKQKELKFKVGDKVYMGRFDRDKVNILTITGIEEDRYLTDSAYGPILFSDENNWERIEQKPWKVGANAYFIPEQKLTEKETTLTSFEETLNTFLFDFANSPIEDCEPKQYVKKHSAEILKASYKELNAQLKQDIFEAQQEGRREGYEAARAEAVEWSEEDEKMLASFLHKVEVCDLLTNKENVWIVERLKSLRPQPKAELTLLDENIIEAAVAFVEQNNHFDCWRGIDKHTVIKDLRSLKPHWKPSKDQMEALLNTLHPDDPYYPELKSLYEQLQKL